MTKKEKLKLAESLFSGVIALKQTLENSKELKNESPLNLLAHGFVMGAISVSDGLDNEDISEQVHNIAKQ